MYSLALSFTLANTAFAAYTFEPLKHLAGIAPYFEPADPPIDPKPAQGCNVTRASYLVRHAAIYANDFDYEEYIEPFTDKLKNTSVDWSKAAPLAFLGTWQTPISDEELEDLTKVGMLESYSLGVDISMRYPSFKAPKKVWTSTAERTELSAKSFIDGLVEKSNETEKVSVPESEAEGADSLTPYKGCPKYSSSAGSDQASVSISFVQSPGHMLTFRRNTKTCTLERLSHASTILLLVSTSLQTTSLGCNSCAVMRPLFVDPRPSVR